jgi:alpha-tubulin suppressor-like RCC1 family protein
MQVQRPVQIKFEEKSLGEAPVHIVSAACGFNHVLALTTQGRLFAWGRRMGIYPNCELSQEYLESP